MVSAVALPLFAAALAACAQKASAPHTTPVPSALVIPSYQVTVEDGPCNFDFPGGLDTARIRCGWVTVPENRDGGERSLRLAFAVLETDAVEPAAPLLVLDGGPGGSTLQGLLGWFTKSFAEPLLSKRNLVFFDYRGTGLSQPDMSCPELDALGLDPDAGDQAAGEALLVCRERIVDAGVDLDQYHSAALAADGADVMSALGYDAYTVYGVSYGTRVALTMLRDRPEGIGAAVLDSVYPPQVDLYAGLVLHQQQALDRALASCANDAVCGAAYPDLSSRLYALLAEATQSPLHVPYADAATGDRKTADVDGRRLLGAFFRAVYDASYLPLLPAMVAGIERGDYTTLATIVASQSGGGSTGAVPLRSTILGSEELPFASNEAIEEQAQRLRPEVAETGINVIDESELEREREFYEEWGVEARPSIETEAVTSDVPVLLLAGEFDPTTPPAWAGLAAETLSRSSVVELRGLGHSVLFQRQTECPMTLIATFLEDPSRPLDASCADDYAIPWFSP
jgi:pimeloyl-ACP methyl ester carboxylesterase